MTKAAKKGHNSVAGEQLLRIVERIETLKETQADLASDVKDIYAESKSNGFDVATIRKCIKLRAMDADKRAEEQYLLETYCKALGMAALD